MAQHSIQFDKSFVVNEVEVSYKQSFVTEVRPKILTSKNAFEILLQSWNMNTIELRETFKILLLKRDNRVLGIFEVSTGGVSSTVVDPKLIFVTALKTNASSIILAHNHPSGNLSPSESDKVLTKKLKEGGKLLDIQVLDHLIISPCSFYSFQDEGEM